MDIETKEVFAALARRRAVMTDLAKPSTIYLSPEDADKFSGKYGHPDLKTVCMGEPFFQYNLSEVEHIPLTQHLKLMRDAERRGRDAGLVEAAALCEVVHNDRINRGSLRIGAGWFEIRDAILALRTSPAEPSDAEATVTVQQAARVLLDAFMCEEQKTDFMPAWKAWMKAHDQEDKSRYDALEDWLRALAGASK